MSDFIHATDGNYILQNGLPLSAGGNVQKTVACDIVIKRNTVKNPSSAVKPYDGVSIKPPYASLSTALSGRAFYSPEMISPGVLTYSGETNVVLKDGSHHDVTGLSPRICAESSGDHFGFLYPDAYKENYYFGIKLNDARYLTETNEEHSGFADGGRLDLTNHSNGTSEIAYMNLPNVYYLNLAFNASDYTACRNVYLPKCISIASGFGYQDSFATGKKISVLENFYAPKLKILDADYGMKFAPSATFSNVTASGVQVLNITNVSANNFFPTDTSKSSRSGLSNFWLGRSVSSITANNSRFSFNSNLIANGIITDSSLYNLYPSATYMDCIFDGDVWLQRDSKFLRCDVRGTIHYF